MELLEFEQTYDVTREEAAAILRELADQLARHNSLDFKREGRKYNVSVADNVEVEVEIEIESDSSKLEIEISW